MCVLFCLFFVFCFFVVPLWETAPFLGFCPPFFFFWLCFLKPRKPEVLTQPSNRTRHTMSDSSTQPPGSGEKVERVVPGPLSTSLADALDDPRSAAAAHAHTSNSTSCDPTQSTSSDPTQSTSEFAEGPVAASTLESHSPALASGSTLEKVLQDVRESNPDALDRVPFASEEVEAQCPDGAADSAAAVCDSVLPSPQHQPRYTQKRK